MLPIVRKRSLAIPHGLAFAAAAVCLGLVFASEFGTPDRKLAASDSAGKTSIEAIAETEPKNRERERTGQRPVSGKRRPAPLDTDLLPWFPFFSSSGG